MATLEQRITALAQSIGTDIKALRAADGNLASLTTTAQNNLVAAINEVKSIADSAGGGDVTTSELNTAINNLRDELRGGAGAALDTFAELEAALAADADFASTIATSLGAKVDVNAAQAFSAGQQQQACENINIGNPDTDFTASYVAERDS